MNDLRHGFRVLVQQPAFAVTAILALALGIGSTTAIFTFVDGLLLRPLPYPQPDQLVMLYENAFGARDNSVSPANWMDWQKADGTFAALAAWNRGTAILTGEGEPEVLNSQVVSYEFLPLLQVRPWRGRYFTAEEDRPRGPAVAILSHSLWQRRFGGEESVIGRTIQLSNTPTRVIGVMPPGFHAAAKDIDVWQPYGLDRARDWRRNAGRFMTVLGRLKPGVAVEAAQARMTAEAKRLEQDYPAFNKNTSVTVMPLREAMTGKVQTALVILLGAVGALLLIACFNVANLLLARSVARRREMSVRTALGAGGWRIVRQLLTENLMLAAAGCGLGLLLANWLVTGLLALVPKGLVQTAELPLDVRVVAFAVAASVISCLLFGFAPAVESARPDVSASMQAGGRGATRRTAALRHGFILAQVGLTTILLCGAGLLMRSFLNLRAVETGIDPRNVVTMRVGLPVARYREAADRVRFFREALEKIRALPGVEAASAVNGLHMGGPSSGTAVNVQGQPVLPIHQAHLTRVRVAMPGYFRTMKTRVLRGREFEDGDLRVDLGPRFVVNETFARRYLGGADPLTQSITVWMQSENPYGPVIGVVADIREAIDKPAEPEVFYTYGRLTAAALTLTVRARNDVPVAREVEKIVRGMDANQPVTQVRSMEEFLGESIARQRMNAVVLGAFAVSALLLAAIGIYGMLATLVAERRREIGVRMAVGARAGHVMKLVTAQGMAPAAIGAALGLVASAGLSRYLSTQLFELKPADPLTMAGSAALLALVALAAVLIPARRATQIDPVVALRQE